MAAKMIVLIGGLFFVPSDVFAQQFYAGAAYDAGVDADIEPGAAQSSGVIAFTGVKIDMSDRFFLAGEAESRVWSGDDAGTGFSYVDQPSNRYRALVGANLPSFSVYIGTASRDYLAEEGSTGSGPTINLGVDMPLSDNVTLRVESIGQPGEGNTMSNPFEPDHLRVGTIFRF